VILFQSRWPAWQAGLLCLLCACSSSSSSGSGLLEVPKRTLKHKQWASVFSATGDVSIASVATAPSGHVFVGGEFSGELRAGKHRVQSKGDTDGFAAHLAPDGRVIWVRAYGNDARDRVTAIALGRPRNLIIAGANGNAAFVAFSHSRGKIDWFSREKLTSTGRVHIRDIAMDTRGGAVAVGHFSGTLTARKLKVTSAGVQDGFIARFHADGRLVWLHRFGGKWADHAHAVALRGDQVVVVGGFTRIAYFANREVQSRGRSMDAFVANLDLRGKLRWVKPAGGDSRDTATAVAIDSFGTIYFAGHFSGAASFGAEPIIAVDGPDVFITALAKTGKTRWTKRFGGSSGERAHSLTTQGKRAYLLGSFIGTTRVNDYPIRGEQKHDGFVATFTDAGELHSAIPVAGKGDDSVRDIAIDSKGAAIIVGSFIGPSELVPGKPMANDDKVTGGFVVRISP